MPWRGWVGLGLGEGGVGDGLMGGWGIDEDGWGGGREDGLGEDGRVGDVVGVPSFMASPQTRGETVERSGANMIRRHKEVHIFLVKMYS